MHATEQRRGPAVRRPVTSPASEVRHCAVVAPADEVAGLLAPLVQAGIAGGEPVAVNLSSRHLESLQDCLGADAGRVSWSDTDEWLPHPVRRLRVFEAMLEERRASGSGPSWWIGECAWPEGPLEELVEWERFDALLGPLLAGTEMRMVCVYDTSRVPADVIGRAGAIHPQVGITPVRRSAAYVPCERFLAATTPPALDVPEGAMRSPGRLRPAEARSFVAGFAAPLLSEAELDELGVVVSELVTNSWRSGAPEIELSCWSEGRTVVVQVDDDGPGMDDPLAGYRRPPADAPGGRGLWIARQLADLVQIAPRSPGTSVRARLSAKLAAPGAGSSALLRT